MSASKPKALSWAQLTKLVEGEAEIDTARGPANPGATIRLFGTDTPTSVRVTLYRDRHFWCPYCQKVALWLEENKVSYRVRKVTMFCYGTKEAWYKKLVPSGMLPAVELDGRLITESDEILAALEDAFGPLGVSMHEPAVRELRQLERTLFRAWCEWLCRPAAGDAQRAVFIDVAKRVEKALSVTRGPFFLGEDCALSVADVVCVPYLERMVASLFYFKAYDVRKKHPRFDAWFCAWERRSAYRGLQSDAHTHVHDLPPQMGGCYASGDAKKVARAQKLVDEGPFFEKVPDCGFGAPPNATRIALLRVLKHRDVLLRVNCVQDTRVVDEALRAALTNLAMSESNVDNSNGLVAPAGGDDAATALRYLRDRISVPRDMPLHSARALRNALESTASLVSDAQGPPIPTKHRRDQDPTPFHSVL